MVCACSWERKKVADNHAWWRLVGPQTSNRWWACKIDLRRFQGNTRTLYDHRNLLLGGFAADNTHVMQLRCLLMGVDDAHVRPVRAALNMIGLRCEYVTYSTGSDRVQKGRYEAIILMYDGTPAAGEMVQRIRSGVSNRDSVIFLMSTPSSQETAFRVRANFFISPPITEQSVITTFKAAYGLLVRSRSRWHREPVNGNAFLNLGLIKNVPAAILNLSQGGMSLKCAQLLRQQQLVLARFGLPGTDELVCVSAQVVWTRTDGTVGLRFSDIPEPISKALRNWVEEKLELAKVYATFRERTGTGAQLAVTH